MHPDKPTKGFPAGCTVNLRTFSQGFPVPPRWEGAEKIGEGDA